MTNRWCPNDPLDKLRSELFGIDIVDLDVYSPQYIHVYNNQNIFSKKM